MNIFTGIAKAFASLGNTDTIEYDDTVVMFDPMLLEALDSIKNGKLIKEVESAVNVSGGSKKGKGGLKKKYEAPTADIKEMTPENLEKMRKTLSGHDELTK